MNKIFIRHWFITLLSLCLPIGLVGQTKKFEMVVEKTDGTECIFQINDDYPLLEVQYGNVLYITDVNDRSVIMNGSEIKCIFTREQGISDAIITVQTDSSKFAIYDLIGRKIETDDISTLPPGIYIRNGQKLIVQ